MFAAGARGGNRTSACTPAGDLRRVANVASSLQSPDISHGQITVASKRGLDYHRKRMK
jgi:hypothetical protein